jgi:putative CocE/NonD family hydrolase
VAAATQAQSSSFRADPRQPVTDPYARPGAHDYSAIAGREDVLTFDSGPLAEDWVVAGEVTAIIHASCDCADFDLWVRLQDVHPDGRAFNVGSPGNDAVRASYRDVVRGPQAVVPGEIYELRLPRAPTAIRFGKGHRIRVQVSASFDPHLSRNLQTGRSEIDSSESRPAVITLHHDADHPSRLLLPRPAGCP